MKLISEPEYVKLVPTNPPLPLSGSEQHFHQKNNLAGSLLTLDNIPDDVKLALFNRVYNNINEHLSSLKSDQSKVKVELINPSSIKMEKEDKMGLEDDVEKHDRLMIQTLPDKVKNAAEALTGLLKTHPSVVSWDNSGNVSFSGVKSENGANIHDLLSYVLRPTLKFETPPPGVKTFLHILEVLNIPTTLFGVHIRKELAKSNAEELRKRVTLSSKEISKRRSKRTNSLDEELSSSQKKEDSLLNTNEEANKKHRSNSFSDQSSWTPAVSVVNEDKAKNSYNWLSFRFTK